MANKVLVVISSGEEAMEKALTGMMYAINAKKNNWMDEVNLMFFGPSEKMIAHAEQGSQVSEFLKQAVDLGLTPVACRAISDRENITTELSGLGINVEYVGTTLSSFIKKDYQVITF